MGWRQDLLLICLFQTTILLSLERQLDPLEPSFQGFLLSWPVIAANDGSLITHGWARWPPTRRTHASSGSTTASGRADQHPIPAHAIRTAEEGGEWNRAHHAVRPRERSGRRRTTSLRTDGELRAVTGTAAMFLGRPDRATAYRIHRVHQPDPDASRGPLAGSSGGGDARRLKVALQVPSASCCGAGGWLLLGSRLASCLLYHHS